MAKKKKQQTNTASSTPTPRAPVVAVMGHIDHGKSTLLDYIRNTNVVSGEAGGITQHISAYEFEHTPKEGSARNITFLDTPGHEAFSATRIRGARVADIAVLVVSAEDGVKPQTKEAITYLKEAQTPFVVAITKIDLPNADIERTKTNLAENEIYLEGYGGDVPNVAISAKTGENVDDLLDTLLLMADLEELMGTPSAPARGVVIESNMDDKKGASASIVIKDGTLSQGMAVATDTSFAPVRIMEDFTGKPLREATFSSPVKIYGWNTLPAVGSACVSFANKKEAEQHIQQPDTQSPHASIETADDTTAINLIVVADTAGTLEAVVDQVQTLSNDRITVHILSASTGTITEKEVKRASMQDNTAIVGFNTSTDAAAHNAAERYEIDIQTFSVIYDLLDWVREHTTKLTPVAYEDKTHARVKILKTFSAKKNVQVIGGSVIDGEISTGDTVKIFRRDEEVGTGTVKGLQLQQMKADKVESGNECGLMVEARLEIARGDVLEAFRKVEM